MWWSEADSMRNWIQVRSWATRAFRSNPFKDKRMKNKILTETEKEPKLTIKKFCRLKNFFLFDKNENNKWTFSVPRSPRCKR